MPKPSENSAGFEFPKTLRYCKVCRRDTPHQIRAGAGVIARICIVCLERVLGHELDRD